MKRRDRPFDNNPECAERQAVFRERPREVESVSTDGAHPLMEPVDCPVLSSSSFGVDAQQPVAVDLDPILRRSLMRASKGDSEITEICSRISDGNVNEEPHPQASAREITDEVERQRPCWHKRPGTGMFSVRHGDVLCCASALSLNLVMAILIVVVNKCAVHVFPIPQHLKISTTSVFGERSPGFVALVFWRLNRFIRNIVGHSGFCSCPGHLAMHCSTLL